MKLWHDDIRKPPTEGWIWCRTNREAEILLATGRVGTVSLDHDLGLDGMSPDHPMASVLKGSGEKTGLDLARWMVEHREEIASDDVLPRVYIHSMNPVGAKAMHDTLVAAGYFAIIEPYRAWVALGARVV